MRTWGTIKHHMKNPQNTGMNCSEDGIKCSFHFWTLCDFVSPESADFPQLTVEISAKTLQNTTSKQGREGPCLPLCLQPSRRQNLMTSHLLLWQAQSQQEFTELSFHFAKILGSSPTELHTRGDFQWAGAWQCKGFTFVTLRATKRWAWTRCILCFVNLLLSVTRSQLKGV